jgi:hypothetical protein
MLLEVRPMNYHPDSLPDDLASVIAKRNRELFERDPEAWRELQRQRDREHLASLPNQRVEREQR